MDPTPRRTRLVRTTPGARGTVTLAVVVSLGAMVVGCGDDDAGDAERFCGEIDANREALTRPQIEFADEIEPFLALYRTIGEYAPLAIEEEWDQLIANYETASTVVRGDPQSEQLAIATALQSEKAAITVERWLRENCAVELGPLATLAPQEPDGTAAATDDSTTATAADPADG